MANFKTYNGQTFSDVAVNTYGTMDYYVKLLNDNNLTPESVPVSGGEVVWDTNIVQDQSVQTLISNNNVIFATMPTDEELISLLPARLQLENTNYILQENGRFILLWAH